MPVYGSSIQDGRKKQAAFTARSFINLQHIIHPAVHIEQNSAPAFPPMPRCFISSSASSRVLMP